MRISCYPFLLILFLLTISTCAKGQAIKEKIELLKEKQQDIKKQIFEDTSGKSNYIIYPTLAYTPETNIEFGLVNLFLFYAKQDRKNRLSEVNTFTFYTFEKQYGIWFDHAIYGNHDTWFFLGKGKIQYFPLKYYGIGMKTNQNEYQIVNNSSIQIRERVLHKVKGDFYVGLEFDHHNIYNISLTQEQFLPQSTLPLGYQGSNNTAFGFGLVYDTRRNVMNVRNGFFSEVAYLNYSKLLTSQYPFQSIQIDSRYFRKGFAPNQVWAFQALGNFNFGNVPFNQLALMGGESIMRGYYLGRYRDKQMINVQAEYRFLPFSFSKRFGGSLFLAAGAIAPNLGSFTFPNTQVAGGFGAKYLIFKAKDIFVRFDFAFTKEGQGYYFFIGEAF